MKLVINIPCYNEEKTLPLVLKELPKKIKGIDQIEVQIVNDGSTDKTSDVARSYGVKRIIEHGYNRGLGCAFKSGMEEALKNGADIFVNTDGDNQYPSRYIEKLVEPIINGSADIVVGNRVPWNVKHFSFIKRKLQYTGNYFVRNIVKSNVKDAVSGFRAYNKEAMLRINVTTRYSYVLDTSVQAYYKNLRVDNCLININKPTRKSRLFNNIFEHCIRSGLNLLRLYYLYEPFKTFFMFSFLLFIPGFFLLMRFFVFYLFLGEGSGHIQSLIVSSILLVGSILMFGLAVIGDSMKTNRTIQEENLYLTKKRIYR
jgi:glycosyltransferase involved in cell wall biosynthesis